MRPKKIAVFAQSGLSCTIQYSYGTKAGAILRACRLCGQGCDDSVLCRPVGGRGRGNLKGQMGESMTSTVAETGSDLGWALIGCGGAGRGHAGWASSTAAIVIRGFCDIEAGMAQRLNREHGGEYATTDPEGSLPTPLWISSQSQHPTAPTLIWRWPPVSPASICSWKSLLP